MNNSKNQKIVFVIGAYKNGGVARHSTVLANALAEKGMSCSLLATKEVDPQSYFAIAPGVTLIDLKEYNQKHCQDKSYQKSERRLMNSVLWKKRILRYFGALMSETAKHAIQNEIKAVRRGQELRCFVQNNREAVFVPFGIDYYEKIYAATLNTKRHLIFAERNAPQSENVDEEQLELSGKMLAHADACIFQTEDEATYYKAYLSDRKTYVIHNPLTAGLPEPYSGPRRPVIVNFCRMADQKNLPLLVEAFERVHKKYPEYSLEIYGNTVTEEEERIATAIKVLIAEKNLSDYAMVYPARNDIHAAIQDCGMFVSSSDFEGLSNSMIEAMAIGMPCVCTDCLGGGAREMICDGKNGLLVPMKNPDALAQAMMKYIEDNKLAERCGQEAAKIRDTLSVSKIANQWKACIDSVTGE